MSIYGKLISNTLTIAPRRLTIDGCVVFNPTGEQYAAAGYLPVTYTDAPVAPEGFFPVSGWEERDGEIVQVWEFAPNPEPTPDEALTRYANELTGENDPDLVSAIETLIKHFTEE